MHSLKDFMHTYFLNFIYPFYAFIYLYFQKKKNSQQKAFLEIFYIKKYKRNKQHSFCSCCLINLYTSFANLHVSYT